MRQAVEPLSQSIGNARAALRLRSLSRWPFLCGHSLLFALLHLGEQLVALTLQASTHRFHFEPFLGKLLAFGKPYAVPLRRRAEAALAVQPVLNLRIAGGKAPTNEFHVSFADKTRVRAFDDLFWRRDSADARAAVADSAIDGAAGG